MSAIDIADRFAGAFREEAMEVLAELETALLGLEQRAGDAALVARVFRALHTLKGSGAMFGFTAIASLAHALESAFDEVRQGKLAVSRELVSLALGGKDQIRTLLDGDDPVCEAARAKIVGALQALGVSAAPMRGAHAEIAAASARRRYHVHFNPQAELLADGTNPIGLWAELSGLGDACVRAETSRIPELDAIDPEACYVAWEATLVTEQEEAAVRDVFMFVEDRGELRIRAENLDAGDIGTAPDCGGVVLFSDPPPEPVPAEARPQRPTGERSALPTPKASVRVAAERLDTLVDLVGELVIAQARLSQIAARREDAEIASIAEDIERLTSDLRDNTLNLRMVPIGSTFGRFKRLVRDLANELGKEIELVTEGAETELDKTVIERLGDPLVHILRNCCDHGIEAPAARVARGKPACGTVRLAAYQSGPNVVVEIQDDGAGMNRDAIRARALARGLIDGAERLGDQDLLQLVFLPGFSTAAVVSSVSGRGVGMDIVKRSVEGLRGTLEIVSEEGRGTTLRIKLPLTLAIIDGLLVSVGAGRYVLPMSVVEECVEITREQVVAAHHNHVVPVRGELVPYVRLREWFGEEGARPPVEQIAIANAEGMRFGFAVDDVIGQHQTVIKTLGRMCRGAEGVCGATILGDGTVALIVDVAGVVRTATREAQARA